MFTPLAFPDLPDAACLQYDPETFFPTSGETTKQAGAKRICGTCTVRDDCLEFALTAMANGEVIHGTWGGKSPTERAKLITKRNASVKVCRNGHVKTPDSTTPNGSCRACAQAAWRRHYDRNKGSVA